MERDELPNHDKGPCVSNRRKEERNQSKARQQSKGKRRQTKLACSLRYSITMFMPLPWTKPAHIRQQTHARTRYKLDSLVFPLRPKHPDTPLPGPSRPSSCRARHSTLHLLLRHSVLVICPDTITLQFRDEHMNMQSHRRVNTQYIKDLGQNSHIKHFSHHFGFSFQFLVYFPYVSGKKNG